VLLSNTFKKYLGLGLSAKLCNYASQHKLISQQNMPRIPKLTYDRGTLILHPPPKGKAWIEFATWDDRIEKFRIPANHYRELILTLRSEGIAIEDKSRGYQEVKLISHTKMEPYPHQSEALAAWQRVGKCGVVVLPTAAGKTYLAQLAMQVTNRSTLVVVPTLDLMHQWYAHLLAAFPDVEIGLLGGGSRDRTSILVSTYDSAAKEVYRKSSEDLAGQALAEHKIVQIKVSLSAQERDRYDSLIESRNMFLKESKISLGSLEGWQRFVQASARSQAGRRAMLAHRESKEISLGTEAKLRVLSDLLAQHFGERILIFTNDNATVYRISQDLLIPALTHQTPVKERHEILTFFREGKYKTLATSHVLNEGVDVPDARIAILLSGTGSAREYIQRLGRVLRRGTEANKQAILYEVVTEDTSEVRTSERRRGIERSRSELPQDNVMQIGIKYDKDIHKKQAIAAENPNDYDI